MNAPSEASDLPDERSDEVVKRVVHAFDARARSGAVRGPISGKPVGHRSDAHLSTLVDYRSSVALMSGRHSGEPHLAHGPLGLAPKHLDRWLTLFEATAPEVCQGRPAAFFADRARRIADGLQIGTGAKAIRLPIKTAGAPP